MRVAENYVRIDGILNEVDIEYGSYTKDGKAVECIRGTISVLVENTPIREKETDLIIPVHIFANKLKKDGTQSISYDNLKKVKEEYNSIAAVGKENADRISINGRINMNEFYAADDRLISYPRIESSFINKNTNPNFEPKAVFNAEIVIGKKGYVTRIVDEQEVQTYEVTGIIPVYGDRAIVVPFVANNNEAADFMDQMWNVNDTVDIRGKVNFTSSTEEVTVQEGWGEPITKKRTTRISELIITGGSEIPKEGDFAFDVQDIQKALEDRKARLEISKERSISNAKAQKAPAPIGSVSAATSTSDFGF